MATESKPQAWEAVDRLYELADIGVAAETVAKALAPIIERRLGYLLDQFGKCPPELGPLLDLKAQISEVWRLRQELKIQAMKGQTALEALQKMMNWHVREPDKQPK